VCARPALASEPVKHRTLGLMTACASSSSGRTQVGLRRGYPTRLPCGLVVEYLVATGRQNGVDQDHDRRAVVHWFVARAYQQRQQQRDAERHDQHDHGPHPDADVQREERQDRDHEGEQVLGGVREVHEDAGVVVDDPAVGRGVDALDARSRVGVAPVGHELGVHELAVDARVDQQVEDEAHETQDAIRPDVACVAGHGAQGILLS
jgi:hypothetical protein